MPFGIPGIQMNISTLMPQSHCVESAPEWGRIDNSSLFGWSFLVIPGHSSNDTDNDNQFEQCSRPCSFGRSVRKFWTCSKSLCTQQCPALILFIRGYAYRILGPCKGDSDTQSIMAMQGGFWYAQYYCHAKVILICTILWPCKGILIKTTYNPSINISQKHIKMN